MRETNDYCATTHTVYNVPELLAIFNPPSQFNTHTFAFFTQQLCLYKMWLVPTDHYQPDVHVPAMLLICLTHIGDPSTEKARLATS